jgi:hypothetical protein
MSGIVRRTIDELLARYELEPGLEDVFVEGCFDKEIIESALPTDTKKAIYEIDTVEIPFELLIRHQLTEGRKQRVIVLARELSNLPHQCSYICLADKDLDHWFGELESTERLRWTKYCSIEMHFFSRDLLENLLIKTCKARIQDFERFYSTVITVLSTLYALRLADKQLGFKLRWVPMEGDLTRIGDEVSLALEVSLDRLLQANGKNQQRNQFTEIFTRYMNEFHGDFRDHIRGHDFVSVLAWAVTKYKGMREFASEAAIQRLFILATRLSTDVAEEIRATICE